MAEKNQKPTAKRLWEARQRGHIARSREWSLLATLGVMLVWGWLGLEDIATHLSHCALQSWSLASASELPLRIAGVVDACARTSSRDLLLLMGLLSVTLLVLQLVQTRALFAPKALRFSWQRVDLRQGMQRMLSRWQGLDSLKVGMVLLAFCLLALSVWHLSWPLLREGMLWQANALATRSLQPLRWLVLGGVMLALMLAVSDSVYQRWRYMKELAMSHRDVTREQRQQEGNPELQQERKALHQQLLDEGLLARVRQADVLLINPIHLAVAIAYGETQQADAQAPQISAKGEGDRAARMRATARAAKVPIIANPELTRALYVYEEGESIPRPLYEAIAAVLHAAWALREGEGPLAAGEGDAGV